MLQKYLKSGIVALIILAAVRAEGQNINARLVYFAPAADDPAELFIPGLKEGEFVKCSPTASVLAEPTSCRLGTGGKVSFSKSATGGDTIATAVVPEGVNEAVFFFFRSPDPSRKGYQVLVVDESKAALPGGSSYFCNIIPQNVRLTIGEFNYEMLPGKPAYVKRPRVDASNMAPFRVQLKNGDEWTKVKDTSLRFAETERYFLITSMDAGGRPAVKIYKQPPPSSQPLTVQQER